ncbi:butyrophilin subfamily 1 member A1-like isoform X2 [Rhinatrema bivittatum]|uniref:butyrophilin subfamily 1 member A1-like isoform X2 n=1 Tax=Rhinatrema bivittatum TaxID=194408 RepID=UPI00112B2651|nr:butyrophilin subfamily 1 member A1-like isoform X2 [Rhinatrema bivittatum]
MKMQFPDPPMVRALCSLLVISHHFQTVNAEGFKVIGPDGPVVAVLGGDAELPCRLSPPLSAEHMQVRWFRSRFDALVHLYENGTDQNERQIPEYRGRTELIRTHISNGSVSLRIHSVWLKDEGSYICFFQFDTYYEEATLELKVAALGTAPVISITDHQDRGIRAVCESTGWYPEPEVTWRQEDGQSLTSLSETETQKHNSLFNIKTSLLMRTNKYGKISCRIRNIILSEERETVIPISDAFFRRVSRWVVSLSIILGSGLTICGLLVALVLYHSRKERKEKANLSAQVITNLSAEVTNLSAEVKSLSAELEWRRCCSYAVGVTLDPETAHPRLLLTDDGKTMERGGTGENLRETPLRFNISPCVLGREAFTSGRHFWKVEVGDGRAWELGVCRDSVCRNGWITISPEAGYWAVGLWRGGGYWALTSSKTKLRLHESPRAVGIFLDYEAGEVSFYDAENKSHLFSFSDPLTGPLLPYFCTLDDPLRIRPVPVPDWEGERGAQGYQLRSLGDVERGKGGSRFVLNL